MAFIFLCLVAGMVSALAMAPWGLFPALFLGLSVLYAAVKKSSRPLTAFFCGWVFAFGYFLAGLSWIGNALLVDDNPFAWAWPLAVCGLPLALSFFTGFACLLAKRFSDTNKISGFLAFCAFVAFFEWARGNVFTGFPWNLYGHAWVKLPEILQVLSLGNVYWLTWLTVLWCALPGFLFVSDAKNKKFLAAGLIALFVLCFGFGTWRLHQPLPPARENIRIHLVQANIPQGDKWKREQLWSQFLKQLEFSRPDGPTNGAGTYIVWPETSLNPWVLADPEAMPLITQMLGLYDGPAYLLTGMLRHSPETGSFYNSLVMIDKAGVISNIYDKNHLVPFGEYIPFQEWIPLEPVAKFKGFSGGAGPRTFSTLEGIKYSPVICYEIIFPGRVVKPGTQPDFILNVTNDSWYGLSAGPWQHLYQAVFRAIEEGVPVVRVADTGISAVIGPTGEIVEESGLFTEYEKTLALPDRFMVSKYSGLTDESVFLILIAFFISVGLFVKQKN